MLLTISIVAALAAVAAILSFWRLRLVSSQLAELKPVAERGTQIADAVFADLGKARAELAWLRDCLAVTHTAAGEGIWHWYLDRDEFYFSSNWKRLLGYEESELSSNLASLESLLHPEDAERVVRKLQEFVRSRKKNLDAQYRLRHRNGTYRWFHSRGGRTLDQQGEGEVLVAIQQDITESKQLEAAMMDSQMRFRSLYETAPICFVQWDKDGRVVDWNKCAETTFGWSKAEMMGRSVVQIFSELHQEIFLESVHKLITGEANSTQLTSVNVANSGKALYLEWTNVVLRSFKGTVTGVISLGVDVTARKKEEDELMQYRFDLEEQVAARTQELREAQERLTQIIEGSPFPTFVIDGEHRVTHWNKACEAMFKASAQTMIGQSYALGQVIYGQSKDSLADMVLNNDLARIADTFGDRAWKSTLIDGAYSAEIYLADRALWLAFTATPLKDQNGATIGAIETLEDITQRKVAEERLREAKHLAEDAARIKADFLANMSHEIRTPMNAIIGLTHLALKTPLSPKQRDYLEKIGSAGSMLYALVNDVLDFSKIEAGKLSLEESEFILDESLINVSTMVLTRAQEKGLELRFCIAPEVPQQLVGDALRLNQVLVNLVGNAIKFTEKGSVTVSFSLAERDDQRIRVRVDVTDTGVGMTTEQSSRLFQAFSQADTSTTRKFGGTGLGLIISKRIIDLMGGDIALSSQPGVGTTFTFTFICGVAEGSSDSHAVPETAKGARVLIVDDDPTWCEMFERMLRLLGLRAEFTTSPQAALERMSPGQDDPYALVFIDWHLPGMGGIVLAERIHRRFREARVPGLVMVSMCDLADMEQAIGDLPVAGVLIKPVTALHVVNLISGLFDDDSSLLLSRISHSDSESMLKGMRVLVVDDVTTNQMIATELLSAQGVNVHVAGNGAEAVAAVVTGGRVYDAVLMDIQMPEMDGHEATRRIRALERYANLPIIAMTAHAMEEEKARCFASGMNDIVTKPINPHQLYRVLQQWAKPERGKPAKAEEPLALAPKTPPPLPRETGLFPQLRGIDTAIGLQFMMNKPAVYEKVLKDFHARFKDAVQDMRLAIVRGEREEARRQAHSLKSLAGSIGAKALSAAAMDLELALKDSDKPDSGILETFEESLSEVLDGLSEQFMIQ